MPNTDKTIFLPQLQRYDEKIKGWADNKFLTKVDTPSIPKATATTLGGVKVGNGLNVTDDGTLSVETHSNETSITTSITTTYIYKTGTWDTVCKDTYDVIVSWFDNYNRVFAWVNSRVNSQRPFPQVFVELVKIQEGQIVSTPFTIQYVAPSEKLSFETGITTTALCQIYFNADGSIDFQEGHSNVNQYANGSEFKNEVNGSVAMLSLKDGAITEAKIKDSAISSTKIAPSAVTRTEIADNAIESNHIADGQITVTHIKDGSVTSAKLALNAVNAENINEGAIVPATISDGAIKSAKLANGAVTVEKLASRAVNNDKLADGAVTATKISNGAVTAAKLVSRAVTTDKILDGAITKAKLANGAVTVEKLASSAVFNDKLADSAVTATKISNGAVTAAKLASSAVTTDKVCDGAITKAKLASEAVTTDKIADGAITKAKLASDVGVGGGNSLTSFTAVNGTKLGNWTISTDNNSDSLKCCGAYCDDYIYIQSEYITWNNASRVVVKITRTDGKKIALGDVTTDRETYSPNTGCIVSIIGKTETIKDAKLSVNSNAVTNSITLVKNIGQWEDSPLCFIIGAFICVKE